LSGNDTFGRIMEFREKPKLWFAEHLTKFILYLINWKKVKKINLICVNFTLFDIIMLLDDWSIK
jgi:hypothetical protein